MNFILAPIYLELKNLMIYPRRFYTGMLDKFFDKFLVPTVQTARGCPFKCSFCQKEGKDYFSKICKYSINRIIADLDYISKRAKSPNLYIVEFKFWDVQTRCLLLLMQLRI